MHSGKYPSYNDVELLNIFYLALTKVLELSIDMPETMRNQSSRQPLIDGSKNSDDEFVWLSESISVYRVGSWIKRNQSATIQKIIINQILPGSFPKIIMPSEEIQLRSSGEIMLFLAISYMYVCMIHMHDIGQAIESLRISHSFICANYS